MLKADFLATPFKPQNIGVIRQWSTCFLAAGQSLKSTTHYITLRRTLFPELPGVPTKTLKLRILLTELLATTKRLLLQLPELLMDNTVGGREAGAPAILNQTMGDDDDDIVATKVGAEAVVEASPLELLPLEQQA